MQLKQNAAIGVKWTAISNWANQIISFGVFFVLARMLEPESFGLVALAGVYTSFLELFVSQGLGMAIIQKKDLEKSHLDTVFWTSLSSGCVLAFLTFLLSDPISTLMGEPKLQPILALMSLVFVLVALNNVQSAILTKELKFKELAIRQIFSLVGGGIVGVVMAWQDFGAWSLIGQQLTRSGISVLVIWNVSRWRPGLNFSSKHLKELLSFSWAVMSSNIFTFLSNRGDQFIIGKVLGTIQLGFYSIAQRLIQLLSLGLVNPISSVALPVLSKIQSDPQKISNTIYKGLEIISLFCFPVYALIICLAPDIIHLLFGIKWIAAGNIMRILVLSEAIRLLAIFGYPTYISCGKPYYSLWVTMVKSVCILGAAFAGLKWGLIGVAWGVNVTCIITVSISIFLLKKLLPLKLVNILQSLKTSLLCSIVMSVVIFWLFNVFFIKISVYVRVPILLISGIAIYIVSLCIVSPRLFSLGIDSIAMFFQRKKAIKINPINV